MPSRAPRVALLGVTLFLVLAAPAAAATISVAPDGVDSQCARDGSPCRSLTRAESIAEPGDTINLAAGVYVEAPVTVDVENLTIRGAGPGTLVAAASAGDTITFEEDGSVEKLTFAQTAGAGSALSSTAALTASEVTFLVTTAGGAGALRLSGSGDLDRVNAIHTQGRALNVVSPSSGDDSVNAVTADSSIFSAAAGEYGIAVTSPAASGLNLASTADDVTLDLRHVTVAGPDGAKGLLLDASDANGCQPFSPVTCFTTTDPAANMTATLSDTIVDGTSEVIANGPGDTGADNSAKLVFSGKNLADAVSGTTEGSATGAADAAKLFWANNDLVLMLRQDATAAIDQGSANPAAGEPALDFYGDPRKLGAATDIGADEWVNRAPVAALKADKDNPAPGEEITFESTSRDPEDGFGGGIVNYYWDFGDGTQRVTQSPAIKHTFATEGDKVIKLAVEDNLGEFSPAAELKLLVSPIPDRAAPKVELLQPKAGQKLKLRGKRTGKRKRNGKRRRVPLQLTVLGGVTDATGIKQVDVALRLVKRRKGKRLSGGRCEFYGGKRRFSRVDCDEPVWLKVVRDKSAWRFRTRKGWRVPPGNYELVARGTDIVGNVSSAAEIADTKLAFRVR